MGLFSKVKGALEAAEKEREQLFRAGTLGKLDVPGSATFDLPSGKIAVTFQLNKPSTGGEKFDMYWKRPEIKLDVTGSGGPLEVVQKDGYTQATVGPDRLERITWSSFEVEEAGTYELTSSLLSDWYSEHAANPALLFDPAP